ncbi:MAG TPA: PEP-CTERM sorting domain-containing protein [Terrimicrobiaceae bacterium]|nr:PEP-CTERM sorting domain-containing protein [Terrimicrobiaceae bacterium]
MHLKSLAFSIATALALHSAPAAFLVIDLPGTSAQDSWSGLTPDNYPGYPSYPTSANAWPSPIAGSGTGGALFNKTAGLGFPSSGGGIYVGGMTSGTGSFTLADAAPVAGLETVVFQIDFEGVGSDWATILTGLSLNYNGGSQGLSATFTEVVSAVQTSVQFGQPAYRFSLAFQWDLTAIAGPITAFDVDWTAAEHSVTYGMQLNQGDTMVQAVPEPSVYGMMAAAAIAVLVWRRRRIAFRP